MSSCLVNSPAFRFKQQQRRLQQRKSVAVSVGQGSNSNSPPSWENEEARWLREEQRWIREEQRWLREEKRWNAEKMTWAIDSARMLEEIKVLKQQVEHLQNEKSDGTLLRDLFVMLKTFLDSKPASNGAPENIPSQGRIFPTASTSSPVQEEQNVKKILEVPPLPEENGAAKVTIKRTLRNGTEGEDVKFLQEALMKLGFYSGEEEMEDAYFADGTESAVKSWQSSVGVPEDGMVTAQVFAKFFGPSTNEYKESFSAASSTVVLVEDPEQGSISTENSTVIVKDEQGLVSAGSSTIVIKDVEETTIASSKTRVYLLGENRWADDSRLVQKKEAPQWPLNCLSCGGKGKIICSECDGSGELIVEEQFLEWAGDDPKCLYCGGSGIVVCDVCNDA